MAPFPARQTTESDAVHPVRNNSLPRAGGLKYTQTIYGPGRTGALGMRVSGSRRAPSLSSSLTHAPLIDEDPNEGPSSTSWKNRTPRASVAPASMTRDGESGLGSRAGTINAGRRRHSSLTDGVTLPDITADDTTIDDVPRNRGNVSSQDRPLLGSSIRRRARMASATGSTEADASSEAEPDDVIDSIDFSPALAPIPLARPGEHHASISSDSSISQSYLSRFPVHRRTSSRSVSPSGARPGESEEERLDDSQEEGLDEDAAPRRSSSSRRASWQIRPPPSQDASSYTGQTGERSVDTAPGSSRRPSNAASQRADSKVNPTDGKPSESEGIERPGVAPRSASSPTPTNKANPSNLLQSEGDLVPATAHVRRRRSTPELGQGPFPRNPATAMTQAKTPRIHFQKSSVPSSKDRVPPQQSQAERERQQNAWFSSHSLGPQQVTQRHAQPKKSALSMMLHKPATQPSNPFAQLYAGIAGRNAGPVGAATIDVYFPWASGPSGSGSTSSGVLSTNASSKSFRLSIRKDATMEELIGYGLYCYVEEGWQPALEDKTAKDIPAEIRLSTIGWVLRIVEDGEVDDDYPALDRKLLVGRFGGDEFAVCEASYAQVKQHEAAQGLIQRRASRIAALASQAGGSSAAGTGGGASASTAAATLKGGTMMPPSQQPSRLPTMAGTTGAGLTADRTAPAGSLISVAGTPIIASSSLSRSALTTNPSNGIFLRVLVTPTPEVRYKTTVSVPPEMYLADVLDLICKKRRLANAEEWALVVPDKEIVVPLDRTVDALQGNHDLALVKRSTLGEKGGTAALASRSTNPNASIFKRLSESTHPDKGYYPSSLLNKDVTSAFKSWTVHRRMPISVGPRHERTLTIDGDWIHILPTDARAFHAQHVSFLIGDVKQCKLSSKVTYGFKLVVSSGSGSGGKGGGGGDGGKRYDLEAEDTKNAQEIVREITNRRRESGVKR